MARVLVIANRDSEGDTWSMGAFQYVTAAGQPYYLRNPDVPGMAQAKKYRPGRFF